MTPAPRPSPRPSAVRRARRAGLAAAVLAGLATAPAAADGAGAGTGFGPGRAEITTPQRRPAPPQLDRLGGAPQGRLVVPPEARRGLLRPDLADPDGDGLKGRFDDDSDGDGVGDRFDLSPFGDRAGGGLLRLDPPASP